MWTFSRLLFLSCVAVAVPFAITTAVSTEDIQHCYKQILQMAVVCKTSHSQREKNSKKRKRHEFEPITSEQLAYGPYILPKPCNNCIKGHHRCSIIKPCTGCFSKGLQDVCVVETTRRSYPALLVPNLFSATIQHLTPDDSNTPTSTDPLACESAPSSPNTLSEDSVKNTQPEEEATVSNPPEAKRCKLIVTNIPSKNPLNSNSLELPSDFISMFDGSYTTLVPSSGLLTLKVRQSMDNTTITWSQCLSASAVGILKDARRKISQTSLENVYMITDQ